MAVIKNKKTNTYEDKLPWRDNQNYTFGALTDTFFYNSLGKKVFNVDDIGEGNGLRRVFNGHVFSHAISYVVMGKNYIAGEGRGSSYITENYLDWGYPGVFCFSCFIGMICSLITLTFGEKWFVSMLSLNVILSLFFTPRAESTAFIVFVISYKFWICILGCILATRFWSTLRTVKFVQRFEQKMKLIKIKWRDHQ